MVSDSPAVFEKYIVDALTSRGLKARIVNISEVPVYKIQGVVVNRVKNPYAAVVYGLLAERSINPPGAIASALNRLTWLPKYGPPFAVVSTDYSVEKIEIERPWLLLTAWRLELDGVVTSVEGGKSVVEHRMYMKNPLAKVSLAIPKPSRSFSIFATVNSADGVALSVLRELGLLYAKLTIGEYGGRHYVIDIDPVPPVETREEAMAVAELV